MGKQRIYEDLNPKDKWVKECFEIDLVPYLYTQFLSYDGPLGVY